MKNKNRKKIPGFPIWAVLILASAYTVYPRHQCLWNHYAFYSWQFQNQNDVNKRLVIIEPTKDSLRVHIYPYKIIKKDTIIDGERVKSYVGKPTCIDEVGEVSAQNNKRGEKLNLKISFRGKIYTDLVSMTPFVLADTNKIRELLRK